MILIDHVISNKILILDCSYVASIRNLILNINSYAVLYGNHVAIQVNLTSLALKQPQQMNTLKAI